MSVWFFFGHNSIWLLLCCEAWNEKKLCLVVFVFVVCAASACEGIGQYFFFVIVAFMLNNNNLDLIRSSSQIFPLSLFSYYQKISDMTSLFLLFPLAFLPSGSEWIIILLIVLLLFGGRKIPELMRGLGKGVKSFKDGVREAKEEMDKDSDKDSSKESSKDVDKDSDKENVRK